MIPNMKLKNLLKKSAVPALCAFALAPFAAADYEKFLPDGETLAVFKIENVDALKKHVESDAFAAEFRAKVLDPIFREQKADFPDAFSGEILVALAAVGEDKVFGGVCIADCPPELSLENLTEKFKAPDADAEAADVSVAGVPAKKQGGRFFVVFEGKFIAAESEALLEKIILAVKDGNARGLSASANFAAARERIGDADAWFYADGAAIAKRAYAYAAKSDKENAEKIEKHPETAMFTILATPVVKALAPEALNFYWGKIAFDETAGFSAETSLSWNENKGLVTLITGSLTDGFEKPTLFPLLESASDFSLSSFSLGGALLKTMEIARQATPLFGLAEMQLINLKATKGLDVPAALAALGNGFAAYSVASPEKGTKMLLAQKVSDGDLVIDSVVKISELLGLGENLTKVSAAGTPDIYAFRGDETDGGAAKPGAHFAVIDGWLCLGEKELLELLAARSRDGISAGSVWESAALKAGEARLPAGGSGISCTHIGRTFASVSGMIDELGGLEEYGAGVPEFLGKIDPARDLDYSVVSKTYLGEKELSSKSVVVPNGGGNAVPAPQR